MKRLALGEGSDDIKRIRAGLRKSRVEQGADETSPLPACEAAARFWSERAWSEFAAVPAMSQIILALIREGASTDALAAIATISHDEVLHTELSRDLANGLGGYVTDIPAALPYEPDRVAQASDGSADAWLLGTAISETVSLELMRARLAHTSHPIVRQVLRRVFRDEVVHARMGWALATELFPRASQARRRELGAQAEAFFETLGTTFATGGLPEDVRRDARHLREQTAAQGLGAAPPDVEDQVCVTAIVDVIAPRLRQLGVPVLL